MKVDVLLGLQWGDEGKGKIVDVLTPKYKVVARFQGGPNAGHTLEFNGTKHVLHTIPSGIFHEGIENVIGNGVVLDPVVFHEELKALEKVGVDYKKNLLISQRAHLILPTHKIIDAASEASKGKKKIGSTLRGIGPTYMDKTGRNGLRVGDISHPNFEKRYKKLLEKHEHFIRSIYQFDYTLAEWEEKWFAGIQAMRSMQVINSEYWLNEKLKENTPILAEGAQGSLLDVDFGSYPYVTSSNTISAAACTGLGIAPNRIGEVIGIFKAYCTRVGSGPFPTELENETGEKMRELGGEFGATTGRSRRCGWLDLPALKYAIMINGVTQLTLTKIDVLSGFSDIQICTGYQKNGRASEQFPYAASSEIEPIYEKFEGWEKDLTQLSNTEELPEKVNNYISYLERELSLPIRIVSVGPDRKQTLVRQSVLA